MRQLKITKSITNRESASLDKYLQEIGKEELITVEEEVELAQRIKKGDQEALDPQGTKAAQDQVHRPGHEDHQRKGRRVHRNLRGRR